jgi:hypothetical protein
MPRSPQAVAVTLDETTTMGWQDIPFYSPYELSPSSYRVIFVFLHESNGFDDVNEH